MRKDEISARLRSYSKARLSPTEEERALVSTLYAALKDCLGAASTLQIGSYPRFTAVTPVHDLDVLYIAGAWAGDSGDPATTLNDLRHRLESDFENPTAYRLELDRGSHSITMRFMSQASEVLSVDVVPAYTSGRNEFGDDMYVVPELILRGHAARRHLYDDVRKGTHAMQWIKSDPRGYITVATQLDRRNGDFRKAVKILKAWRASCKRMNDRFPLKSFHVEQAVSEHFAARADWQIFDAVFTFLCDLPELMQRSRYPDRADSSRRIDEYVDKLSDAERRLVQQARDCFLIKLEAFEASTSVAELLTACVRERASASERYLFDSRIPVLTEGHLRIVATALPRQGGFRETVLDALGLIAVDRKIEFRLRDEVPAGAMLKWKVKNDDSSEQPRGEITDHRTRNDPEHTKYRGHHNVECYAIRDGVCIARGRQAVVLGNE